MFSGKIIGVNQRCVRALKVETFQKIYEKCDFHDVLDLARTTRTYNVQKRVPLIQETCSSTKIGENTVS